MSRPADSGALGCLLNLTAFGAFAFAVLLGQPGHLDSTPAEPSPAAVEIHALADRFDCWTSLDPRPGVIPGGVLFTRGADVRHSASDSVTGHYLDNLGSPHLAAFCTR